MFPYYDFLQITIKGSQTETRSNNYVICSVSQFKIKINLFILNYKKRIKLIKLIIRI